MLYLLFTTTTTFIPALKIVSFSCPNKIKIKIKRGILSRENKGQLSLKELELIKIEKSSSKSCSDVDLGQ